tara:strand:- start:73 stop:867 length:795 start_codon:yes stop_codon:yes gene_type:complete
MVSKAIITTTDVRSDISVTDVQSVLAVTLLAAEAVLDPDPKNRWFYDQFSFADLPTFGFGKNPADTLTLSDAISQIGFATAKSDAVTITESINILLEILRAFSDSVSFVDTPVNAVSTALADQYQLNEADAKGVALSKSDSYALSDADVLDFGKGLTDQINLSESLSRTVVFNRAFSDAFSLDDTASAEAIGTEKTNVFSFADAQAFGFGKSASDSFSLSESIDTFVFGKGVADAVSVTENINVLLFSNAAMNAATLNSAPFNE